METAVVKLRTARKYFGPPSCTVVSHPEHWQPFRDSQ